MRLDLKLKSVTLENFRLFEKLEMDFHSQMTVLIGENGAGKTALVEGIAKMMVPLIKLIEIPYFSDREDWPIRKEIFSKNDIRYGSILWTSKINVKCYHNNKTNEIEWEGKSDKSVFGREFKNKGLDDFRKIVWEVDEFRKGKDEVNIPVVIYYPCEKVDNESENGQKRDYPEQDIFNAYENALNARAFDFPRFFEWFKWQEDREARGQGSKTLGIVRKAILSMLNEEGEEEKFADIFVDVSSFGNYRLKLKKGEAELEVSQLSSGEKSLFALVSDIARRLATANPGSEDPVKEGGGIVLIDEIDLHLHPRWQRKVIRKLTETFPNLQFIITTHSPLILGSVRSENIRLLDEGQVFSVPETLGQSVGVIIKRIMGVEESLFEEEISRIFKLLTKNKIEEAKAEIAAIESKSPADIPALREAKAVLKRKEILAE